MKKKTIAGLAALGAVLGTAAAVGIIVKKKRAEEAKKALLPKRNIYIAGGGIAGLSCAYYLIHDCHIPGDSIHIFEESDCLGGGFNVGGDEETGYVCTSPKLLNIHTHANMMDMLKCIPSVNLPNMSVRDEIQHFTDANPIHENARLLDKNREIINHGFGVSKSAVKVIKELLSAKDYNICDISIEDYFITASDFFNSNLWCILSSAYMLPSTTSALELKQILSCVSGETNELFTLSNTVRTQLNLQETVIKAIETYLVAHNVNFATHCAVNDVDFEENSYRIAAIHLNDNGTAKTFYLNDNDLCFFTNGSVSECAAIGDYNSHAERSDEKPASVSLWQSMSEKRDGLGNPEVFRSSEESEIISFTITTKSSVLFDYIKEATNDTENQGVLTTFKGSPWGLTISKVSQPYLSSQSDDSYIICGYGVNVNEYGTYIDKTMKNSSGAEILFELVKFLKLEDKWDEIIADVINVIPCLMPYASASAVPHSYEDKPLIVKDNSCNFAFIGQFARLGGGMSHSSEHAVRTAREAAYRLTKTKKISVPPQKASPMVYKKFIHALKK